MGFGGLGNRRSGLECAARREGIEGGYAEEERAVMNPFFKFTACIRGRYVYYGALN